MIEVIDDMFFWNAEGSFVKDFSKECINTIGFLNTILQYELNCKIEKQQGYSRKLGEIESLNYYVTNKRKFNKKDWSNDNNPHFRINFIKAMNNPHQKKLE